MQNHSDTTLVDFGKMIASLMVVAIHVDAFNDFQLINYCFTTYIKPLVVPFFFVASGFFLGMKIQNTSTSEYDSVIMRYFKRLVIPYTIWGILNFVVEVTVNVVKGVAIKEALIYQCHSLVVTSPGRALWYVQALLILLLVLYVLKIKYIKVLTVVFLIMTISMSLILCLDKYSNVSNFLNMYYKLFLTEHNFVFYGIFFFVGICYGFYDLFDYQKRPYNYLLVIISLFISFLFIELTSQYSNLVIKIYSLLESVAIFGILYQTKAFYSDKTSFVLRKYSTVVYFSHVIIKYGIQFVFMILDINNNFIVFLLTIMSIMLLYYFMICLSHNNKLIDLFYKKAF